MTSVEHGLPHPNADQLSRVPLFASLTAEQLARLAHLLEVEHFPAGRTILREGADGYSFHVLIEGTAEVRHGETVVRTLGASDYFGEVAIVDRTRRTATVVAVQPCIVWSMFGTTFRTLAAEHTDIATALEHVAHTRRD